MPNLSDAVSALNGVSASAAALLRELGISTIQDLASSAMFSLAADIERAHRLALLGGKRQRVLVPLDLIDLPSRTLPVEEMATKPVSVIRSIGTVLSARVESALGVRTVADLAKWRPYETARDMLSVSVGGTGGLVDEDPEMPSELVPSMGRYPTERIQYDVILLDRFLKDTPPAGTSTPPLTHVDPNPATGGAAPPRPIEQSFTPIDVSKQPDAGFLYPAVGAVLTYNQSWYTLGLTLGQLLHSVALAPGETTRIAVIDWTRQQKASTTEEIAEGEALSAELTHGRAISEVTRAVASEAQSGFSQATNMEGSYSFGSGTGMSGSVMGFFGVAGASIANSAGYSQAASMAVSFGRRDVAAQMSQNINDRTQQAANATRNRRAAIVREVSQKESETLSTRALTNFNHMHALTIQYYEVVQLYRTTVELAKVRRCLLLPMKILDFTNVDLVRRFRPVLRQATFSQEIRDLLTDDLSVVIEGNVGPNGPSSDVAAQLRAWQAEASAASSLTLRGSRIGEWYVPRTTGTHGAELTWPAEAKVERITATSPDGKVSHITNLPPGYHNWGHAFLAPLAGWGSLAITFAEKQPDSVKLPIRVQVGIYLSNLGREFNYRHIVEIGGDTDAGGLGRSVPLVTVKPPPSEALVLPHLQENALYYSQAIWKSMSSAALLAQFEGYTFQGRRLAEMVDFTPLATIGNYVAFGFHATDDARWKQFLEEHPDLDLDNPANRVRSEDIVPVPSGGVFAEAVLGRFNAAEKLDITRFWNWQDSPIPITAPEIAPLQAGSRAQAENLTPGQLGQPVLNIVNAPAVPDPTGLGAVLTAVSNGAMFRDMSNAAQTAAAATEVLKAGFQAAGHSEEMAVKYADLAASLMKANMAAKGNGGGTGAGGNAGGSTAPRSTSELPATPSNLGALVNKGRDLDQRQKASTAESEWVPYPGSTGTSSGGDALPPPPAPIATSNEAANLYGTRPASTAKATKSAKAPMERVVQFFIMHEDSDIVVPGDYQFDIEEVLSGVGVSLSFSIGSGRRIGSTRLRIPAGTWNISGYVRVRLPDNVVEVPVTIVPGLDPVLFVAERSQLAVDKVYEVAKSMKVAEGDAVISLYLRPIIQEIKAEREVQLSTDASGSAEVGVQTKADVEATGKLAVAEVKMSGGTALTAGYKVTGSVGASQKVTLTMTYRVIKTLKFDT